MIGYNNKKLRNSVVDGEYLFPHFLVQDEMLMVT